MQSIPDISVIIVNYNTIDFLPGCLDSVETQQGVKSEVFVVDNASTDGSPELVAEKFKAVKLIANADNVGFSRANNQAIDMARGRYLFFLNPDTEVKAGALEAATGYMASHPQVGLAGAKIVNPDGSAQSSVEYRYPGQRHALSALSDLPGRIAWVLGAGIFARTDAIAQIGGFDERYWLYAEDVDLCLSARKKGWQIGFIEDAMIVHWGGQSERETPPASFWRKKLSAEIIFYHKHYSGPTLRAIARANLLQAYWRVASLTVGMPFALDKTRARAKLTKYRVVIESFKSALAKQHR
jgi:GT2 family glycosyltransferase